MTRRSLFAGVLSSLAMLQAPLRARVRNAREWFDPARRPPNGQEFGASVMFTGADLEANDAALHAKLASMIASAREQLMKRTDFNVWRLGHLSMRFRVGRA